MCVSFYFLVVFLSYKQQKCVCVCVRDGPIVAVLCDL